jgi:pilus assembly protein CpaB
MFANRNLLVIAVAVLLAIVAVILANSYLSGVEERDAVAAEENRVVQIAVARVPMVYGTNLTSENIRMVSWPSSSVPAGAFQSTKGLFDGTAPRVALRPIEAGEPILPGKITGPGGRASISSLIETDMRAVAVRINDVAGVAGFVLPGDSVDVLITRTPPDSKNSQITDMLLQNVRVIAIDQNANESDNKPALGKTVTFSVDQLSAQKLALGGQVGTLSLALRNAANQDMPFASTVGLDDLGAGNYTRSYDSVASTAPASPFPYPAMPASNTSRATAKPAMPFKPRDPNSVTVQIVRGTSSSDYEVKRNARY